jgi:hypothetical protein
MDDAGAYQDSTGFPSINQLWAPTDEGTGDREYLYILNRPYSATPKDEFRVDDAISTGLFPVLYTLTAKARDASDVIDDGDVFQFLWANPAIPNDIYAFNTAALNRGNADLAKSNLDKVRVVPNPYYNHSRYELNQFNRIIRFMNLPETCTIRIFNLAGDLVRTLHKTDITNSVVNWDLLTENGLPVGSGVYVFHIDAGSVGTKFGRLVVFMERERLNNF